MGGSNCLIQVGSTVLIQGPPATGAHAAMTADYGLWVASGAVGSNVTNAVGIHIDAPTGATTNYLVTGAAANHLQLFTLDDSGNLASDTFTTPVSAPTATWFTGTAGLIGLGEGTCPTTGIITGLDYLCANASTHNLQLSLNGGAFANVLYSGGPAILNSLTAPMLFGTGAVGTPTCGLGAGTPAPTLGACAVSANSTDAGIQITITTTATPATNGVIAQIPWSNTYSRAPASCPARI